MQELRFWPQKDTNQVLHAVQKLQLRRRMPRRQPQSPIPRQRQLLHAVQDLNF